MSSSSYPPVLTIFLSALLRVVVRIDSIAGKGSNSNDTTRPRIARFFQRIMIVVGFSLLMIFLSPHSYLAAFWNLLRILVSELVAACVLPGVPSFIRHGGPLGRGCSKLVEAVGGLLLLRLQQQQQQQHHHHQTTSSTTDNDDDLNFLLLGPLPTIRVLLLVLFLSLLTIGVLWTWSLICKTRGNHKGVNDMVQSYQGRALLVKEHLTLVFLATVNAACEEVASRGLWRIEFHRCFRIVVDDPNKRLLYSNLCQAVVFGIWHYHGIPNGLIGIALTFVYGLALGFLADYHQHGLLLPILTHAIADYFIFATVARSSIGGNEKKNTEDGKKQR
jgi:Type II CAAX prenyl endopeptidase Rce1-like